MPLVRVRLAFEEPPPGVERRCWYLFDSSSCRVVADFRHLVARRFYGSYPSTTLSLAIDGFVLPPGERIEIVRDGDLIRITLNRTGSQTGHSTMSSLMDRKQHKRAKNSSSDTDSSFDFKQSFTKPVANGVKSTMPVKKKEPSSSNINPTVSWSSTSCSSSSDSETKFQCKTKMSSISKPSANNQCTNRISRQSAANSSRPKALPDQKALPNQTRTRSSTAHSGKKKFNHSLRPETPWNLVQRVSAMQQPVSSSYAINKTCSKAKAPAQQTQKTHIHFDSSESEDEQEERPHKATEVPLVSTSSRNVRKHMTNRQTANVKSKPQTVGGHSDVVTHKSTIYVNESMLSKSKETDQAEQPANEGIRRQLQLPLKDYSTYPLLQGPPRVGDMIAFKMLELSNDYSPVISPYKEASVLAYHADASVVEMQLTADCFAAVKAMKPKGGRKFDLVDPNEVEEEGQEQDEDDVTDLVSVELSSLLEPRLMSSVTV